MRPTRRAIVLAILGLPVALLPAAVDARLWALWPIYLGAFALALGVDALMAPRAAGVAASVAMPGTIYIGEEEEAVLTVGGFRAAGAGDPVPPAFTVVPTTNARAAVRTLHL